MAHAQKPDFAFRQNGRVHLNRRGRQFSRLLAAVLCASAVVLLDTACAELVWEYWLPIPFASFPFTSPPVRHRAPSGLKHTLPDSPFDELSRHSHWKEYCQLSNSTPDSRSETTAILVDSFVRFFRINRKSYRMSCVVIAQRAQRICPGIESNWRRDFPRPSIPALVTTQILYSGYRVKRPKPDINHLRI